MFLDGESIDHVTFASFPRSGNTFCRKYLESILGIVTGSDNHSMMSLFTMGCLLPGFKGEFTVDNRVWVNKSHYPVMLPMASVHTASKVIVCARDPLDAIHSAFNLIYTLTHAKSLTDDTYEKQKESW
jgi:hypothetical protein